MISPAVPASGAEVARHYDVLDPFYREVWGEHLHHGLFDADGDGDRLEAALRLLALVAERAGIRPGARVCDAGCAYGAGARILAEEYGARVTGITPSEAQFRHGRASTAHLQGVELRLGHWTDGAMEPDAFDAVVSIEWLPHEPCPVAFFREVARVLRPGGRFVVAGWMVDPEAGAAAARYLLEPICREGRLTHLATAAEIRGFIREAGLEMGTVEDLTRRVAPTWTVSAARMAMGLLVRQEYRRFLLRSGSPDRIFALTVLRIRLAFAVGALRYGIFSGRLA